MFSQNYKKLQKNQNFVVMLCFDNFFLCNVYFFVFFSVWRFQVTTSTVCLFSKILVCIMPHYPWLYKHLFLKLWASSNIPWTAWCNQLMIPESTARDWRNQYIHLGTVEPLKNIIGFETRGRNRTLNLHDMLILIDIIAQHPTYTYVEICEELGFILNRNISLSCVRSSMMRFGFSRKKIFK